MIFKQIQGSVAVSLERLGLEGDGKRGGLADDVCLVLLKVIFSFSLTWPS